MHYVYVDSSHHPSVKAKEDMMNIGKVSKASGVTAKMIRYYEQIGLIPAAGRNNAGYRSYSANDVERLKFIKRSRELGFSVAEISDLLDLWNNRGRQSADVKRLAECSNAIRISTELLHLSHNILVSEFSAKAIVHSVFALFCGKYREGHRHEQLGSIRVLLGSLSPFTLLDEIFTSA